MKLLLDEHIDIRMKVLLQNFEVYTLHDFDWVGLKNGELGMQIQTNDFQFLVTADKNMPFQQNLDKIKFTLLVLDMPSLLWKNQLRFLPKLLVFLQNPPTLIPKIVHFSIEGMSLGAKKPALIKLVGTEQVLFL